jgi:cold shock CspA family protein
MKGKIKKYFSYRRYGFIEVEGQEDDIFFHASNYPISSIPSVNQEVEFMLNDTPKGKEAIEIKITVVDTINSKASE